MDRIKHLQNVKNFNIHIITIQAKYEDISTCDKLLLQPFIYLFIYILFWLKTLNEVLKVSVKKTIIYRRF